MKTKILILLALTAVVTLSFTFASVKTSGKKSDVPAAQGNISSEPASGFIAEDKF